MKAKIEATVIVAALIVWSISPPLITTVYF
jgi:hypothetical protein